MRAEGKALVTRPELFVLAMAGVVTLGALFAFVPSYWRAPGWTDLPALASGTDERGHHGIGARAPRLTIVEFSDYECPHCRAAHKAMRVLAAKHPDQIRLVHRHLPLDMAAPRAWTGRSTHAPVSSRRRCLEDHATAERIAVDVQEGISRRLTETPSFLVGERLLLGRISEARIEPLLGTTTAGQGGRP